WRTPMQRCTGRGGTDAGWPLCRARTGGRAHRVSRAEAAGAGREAHAATARPAGSGAQPAISLEALGSDRRRSEADSGADSNRNLVILMFTGIVQSVGEIRAVTARG